MQSGNPALGKNTFLDVGTGRVLSGDGVMTSTGRSTRPDFC